MAPHPHPPRRGSCRYSNTPRPNQVSQSRDVNITWSAHQSGIIISLPKASVPSQSYLHSFFAGALLTLFNEKQAIRGANVSPSSPSTSIEIETQTQDDWADVSLDTKTGTAAVVETPRSQSRTVVRAIPPSQAAFDVLPTVETVPRPDDLLQRPPYYLLVHAPGSGRACVEVQCSHSPTLQFLAEYLKKWARTNHNNTTKVSIPCLALPYLTQDFLLLLHCPPPPPVLGIVHRTAL